MSLYQVRNSSNGFEVRKFDDDINFIEKYDINFWGQRTFCTCPARFECRHIKMLPRFESAKAIDTDMLHDYDRNLWVKNHDVE